MFINVRRLFIHVHHSRIYVRHSRIYVRHSREGGNPAVSVNVLKQPTYGWIPAFAGMTIRGAAGMTIKGTAGMTNGELLGKSFV
jgi:hypothetical protein